MKKFIIDAINNSEKQYITYEDFMSFVLYDPQYGYYQKASEKIGRKGDFYTTSSVGTIYGEVIAETFCRFVNENLIEPDFVEIGGGNGRFASAFLQYCEKNEPDIYKKLAYNIVDESKYHRLLQKQALEDHLNVSYFTNISEIETIKNGMLFSNELFDALPVRVVEFQNEKWNEIVLTVNHLNNEIQEQPIEVTDHALIEFLRRNRFHGENGQRVEIPIIMENVFNLMHSKLKRGIILTVDYGFTREEWDAPHRIKGSLRGYYQHELKTKILDHYGEMDLTTHIHWDELKHYAKEKNIDNLYFSSQRNALLDFGILNWLIPHAQSNPFSNEYKHNRAVQSLITPGGISDSFQLLLQTKDMSKLKQSKLFELISQNEYK
jgi:SAM-dependent MidA family methyltransferase